MNKPTDGWWWWRATPESKLKVVHVTASGTRMRRIGYALPMQLAGEFVKKIEAPK